MKLIHLLLPFILSACSSDSSKGNQNNVELSLKNGANVNAIDDWNDTALMLAVRNNNKVIAELLLKYGANVNTSVKGYTALMLAAIIGDASSTIRKAHL